MSTKIKLRQNTAMFLKIGLNFSVHHLVLWYIVIALSDFKLKYANKNRVEAHKMLAKYLYKKLGNRLSNIFLKNFLYFHTILKILSTFWKF